MEFLYEGIIQMFLRKPKYYNLLFYYVDEISLETFYKQKTLKECLATNLFEFRLRFTWSK